MRRSEYGSLPQSRTLSGNLWMRFQFGFGRSQSQAVSMPSVKDDRQSRKQQWTQSSQQKPLAEGFPDGASVVEGGLFIRNEEQDGMGSCGQAHQNCIIQTPSIITQPRPIPNSSVPTDIKKPVSKRIQNWLNFFYPLSPPKHLGGHNVPTTSPPSSVAGSDVESEPIMQRFSPPPKKSILKKKLPSMDLMTGDISMAEPVTSEPEMKRRNLAFQETTILWETYSSDEYNRSAIDYIARGLTPAIATLIKRELNEVKSEMEVHEESRHHTQFYVVNQ